MVKIKFDVSNSDPADAKAGGGEQPKPGVYRAKIAALTPGHAKGQDGKPDKSRPRLEVQVQILKKDGKPDKYVTLYDYISFSEASEWKLDQFLQCFGVATDKKRKGEFDTDKIVGKAFSVRVKADSYDGEYKGKPAAYIPLDEDADDEDDDLDDELEEDLDDEELEDDEEEEDEDEEDEDEDGAYTEDGLNEMSLPQLKKVAEDLGVTARGKAKLIAGILAAQETEEDSDEEVEPEYTMEDMDEMSVGDLKEIFEEKGIAPPARKNKKAMVQALVAAGLVEEDGEEPF